VVNLKDLDALFDRTAPTRYPHTGPVVNRSLEDVLIDSVREQRRVAEVSVTVTLRTEPLSAEEETAARAQLGSFFANEAELASLELRVNRTEGLGSLRYAIPLILLAGLVAGILYTNIWNGGSADLLLALPYLVFITIVWVMLWDPLEKLLFDSYFIRLRIRALEKLSRARVTFQYRPGKVGPREPMRPLES
jgi:hypothetical protein